MSGVEVIGDADADFAYNIGFEEQGVDAWFVPRLVAVIDHFPGLEITIGDKQLVRDASGEWHEPKRLFGRRKK